MLNAPLGGMVALELCHSIAGPYAGMILADLGCRVIKVERPGSGDDTREWGPPFWNGESPTFLAMNRSKESVQLDLKTPLGQEALRRLITRADIVLHNYRPGVPERLGFGYKEASALNPRLVYCTISAFGGEGPLRDEAGYDPLIQALSGIMSITGEPGRPPVRTGTSLIDQGTGMWAALSVMAALLTRRETGLGRHVEVSLYETGLAWLPYQILNYLATGVDPARHGSDTPMISPYGVFETTDGHLMVAAANDHLFRRLCMALGHPHWADDPRFGLNQDRVRNRGELNALIAGTIRQESTAHWEERIRAHGVPCGQVQRISQAVAHPQTEALGMLQPAPHPVVPDLRLVAAPFRIGGARPEVRRAPPMLGADTAAVLAELGLAAETAATPGE